MIRDLPEFLTPEQLANLMGVHPVTARGYCRDGVVPAVKIGRIWMIPRDLVFGELLRKEQELESK